MGKESEKIAKNILKKAGNDCFEVKIEEHVKGKNKFGWLIATAYD